MEHDHHKKRARLNKLALRGIGAIRMRLHKSVHGRLQLVGEGVK